MWPSTTSLGVVDDFMDASLAADSAPGYRAGASMVPTSFALRRLKADRLTEADLPLLRRLHGDERIMATLGGVRTEAETQAYLERNLAHWTEHGFGIWILRDPASGELVGNAGLRHLTVDGVVEVELAYAILPELWGRGLATDAARACVTIGRDWLGLHSVVALTLPSHVASQRVLRNAALIQEREVVHSGRLHLLFRTD